MNEWVITQLSLNKLLKPPEPQLLHLGMGWLQEPKVFTYKQCVSPNCCPLYCPQALGQAGGLRITRGEAYKCRFSGLMQDIYGEVPESIALISSSKWLGQVACLGPSYGKDASMLLTCQVRREEEESERGGKDKETEALLDAGSCQHPLQPDLCPGLHHTGNPQTELVKQFAVPLPVSPLIWRCVWTPSDYPQSSLGIYQI